MTIRRSSSILLVFVSIFGCLAHSQTLSWQGDLSHRFLAARGRNGFLFTIGAEGSEGYIYPFRVFHDLRVTFRTATSGPIHGSAIAQNVTVTPSTVTRFYAGDELRVRETLFVPLEQPVLLLFYEVDSEQPVDLDVSFRPDFDLMWPAGIGGQTYSWDDAHHCFTMEEPSSTYHGRVCSPAVTSHSNPADRTTPWGTDSRLTFTLRAKPHEKIPVIATIGLPDSYNALGLYSKALSGYEGWSQSSEQHYRDLMLHRLQIETGDRETDEALRWATVALDQSLGCNPELGCGQIAGYGATFNTRRPQYAWFFAGDALVTSSALEAVGAHDQTNLALAFVRKYQDMKTGAIWHEISQSANYVDWFHRYPFIYRHTDISPQYLLTVRNIWRSSGDRKMLEESWPSLEAAWMFCLNNLDPKDGLMVIPPDQSGVNENEADRTEKELPLEMVWASGAEAFAELATVMTHPDIAADAKEKAGKAKASLAEFWDPAHNYYFEGLLSGGRPFTQQMLSPLGGVAADLFPVRESNAVVAHVNQPAFKTGWGIRSIPTTDPNYDPDSYAHGSVWPVATATYIAAMLKMHRPEDAWPMWQALVKQSFLDSPGHIPEVLSGATDRPLDVAVPEQTWSTAALVSSTINSIFGLDPDVPRNTLHFAPHLPAQMTHATLRNFAFGQRHLQIILKRDTTHLDLTITNDGEPFQLAFAPMISWKAATASVDGKKLNLSIQTNEHDTHASMTVTVGRTAHIALKP